VSIGRTNFDDISEADLADLIHAGVPEGLAIEYKRDPYGNSDADKREALKDITSFANSVGGYLIIGMEETDGIPVQLTGLPGIDPDTLINRLESLVRDGVEPRMVGIRMRPIRLGNGGTALLIRTPRSWNPPHRVNSGGTNRFYVRNSGGAHEASVEELRVLFTLAADAQQRVKDFRSARVAAIAAGRGPVIVPANGQMIIHIVPLSTFGQAAQIDLEKAYQGLMRFRPMASGGLTTRFNLDGFVNVCDGGRWRSYTQVFRNGILEAAQGGIVRGRGGTAFLHDGARDLVEVVPHYFDGLRELEVPAPIIVMVSYQSVAGALVELNPYQNGLFPPVEPLLLPEIIVDDYGSPQEYVRDLKPILDALWNTAGLRRCTYYDAEGNWNAPH
jgi:hypothetical protein